MRRRKIFVSKALAMMLSLVMMLSMSITAFAITSGTTGSFTVNGLDGSDSVPVLVNAYKIIDVNIDDTSGQPAYPMYTWNTSVAAWVNDNYSSYIGKNNEVVDFDSIEADKREEFLQRLTAQIKVDSIPPTQKVESTGTSATFDNMPMGVYLLTASGGVKLYQPTTVLLVPAESEGSWTITTKSVTMKSNNPTIVKEVTDPDNTVAIGDIVNYKLTVDIPDYPVGASAVKLVVKDRLSDGLTFNSESIQVYLGETAETEDLVNTKNYTFSFPSEDYDFKIDFVKDFIMDNTGGKLTITYSATVNEDAFTIDSLGNTALLGYTNDPYDENSYLEKPDNENVYTYGIQLTKYIKEDENTKTAISGAQFSLSKGGTALKFAKESEGVYVLDNAGSETVEVAADGQLLLKGLDVGVYVLKETKAPNGCVLPSGDITITITDSQPDGTIDLVDVTTSGSSQAESAAVNGNVIEFDVINHDSTFTLPQTGGMGTMLFTILGISLMTGAVAMMIVISKKRKA